MKLSNRTILKFLDDRGWEHCPKYGEPGYHVREEGGLVVLGDYWIRTPDTNERSGYRLDSWGDSKHHPRFWAQLEAQGVCFEGHDDWVIDWERGKAYRCQPDSYGWTPSFVYDEYGDMLTPDSDWSEWLAYALNDARKCLTDTMVPDARLIEEGFDQFNGEFASGWYDGQDDDPHEITERIHAAFPGADIVFIIDSVGQFDIHFNAWFRETE